MMQKYIKLINDKIWLILLPYFSLYCTEIFSMQLSYLKKNLIKMHHQHRQLVIYPNKNNQSTGAAAYEQKIKQYIKQKNKNSIEDYLQAIQIGMSNKKQKNQFYEQICQIMQKNANALLIPIMPLIKIQDKNLNYCNDPGSFQFTESFEITWDTFKQIIDSENLNYIEQKIKRCISQQNKNSIKNYRLMNRVITSEKDKKNQFYEDVNQLAQENADIFFNKATIFMKINEDQFNKIIINIKEINKIESIIKILINQNNKNSIKNYYQMMQTVTSNENQFSKRDSQAIQKLIQQHANIFFTNIKINKNDFQNIVDTKDLKNIKQTIKNCIDPNHKNSIENYLQIIQAVNFDKNKEDNPFYKSIQQLIKSSMIVNANQFEKIIDTEKNTKNLKRIIKGYINRNNKRSIDNYKTMQLITHSDKSNHEEINKLIVNIYENLTKPEANKDQDKIDYKEMTNTVRQENRILNTILKSYWQTAALESGWTVIRSMRLSGLEYMFYNIYTLAKTKLFLQENPNNPDKIFASKKENNEHFKQYNNQLDKAILNNNLKNNALKQEIQIEYNKTKQLLNALLIK